MTSRKQAGGKSKAIPVLLKEASGESRESPPVLTSIAVSARRQLTDRELAALKAELVAVAWEVVLDLLHSAVREVEAALFEQVSSRLRDELPEIVERALRNHLRT